MTPRVLRGFAVVIAIAGLIDPAITTSRRIRPEVALLVADPARDGAAADRVARALRDDFRVLRAPFAGAAASVLVGTTLPDAAARLAEPVFVVTPDRADSQVRFEAVAAPARALLEGTVTVAANVRVTGIRGQLEIALLAGGVTVDRIVRATSAGDEGLHRVRLTFVPTAPGSVPLRLTATVAGETRAAADAVIEVGERRWTVLFHDTRPSWQSTFVRRALERDPRFAVALRVVTSLDASVGAGPAPIALNDAGALTAFDAIVVGAPEGLRDVDVNALERYLRRRGGSVILLADNDAAGAYDQLTAVTAWTVSRADATPIANDAGGDTLRASELRWPRALPAGATPIARDPAGNAVLWSAPVGAGRIFVSGALDAWRLRDPAVSRFDAFWRALIADAAAASPPALDARLAQAVLRPGASTDLIVTLRDLVLAQLAPGTNLQATVAATLEDANGTRALRVLPEDAPGRLRADVRAPETPGLYQVRVSSGGAQSLAALRVMADPALAEPDRSDLLGTWTDARGGATLSAADAGELPAMLARTVPAVRRRETWHPLRSAWWIVPFTLALGAEWWWRRRRGQA